MRCHDDAAPTVQKTLSPTIDTARMTGLASPNLPPTEMATSESRCQELEASIVGLELDVIFLKDLNNRLMQDLDSEQRNATTWERRALEAEARLQRRARNERPRQSPSGV